jgi:hypothetical protein
MLLYWWSLIWITLTSEIVISRDIVRMGNLRRRA